jgi:hypothetical protein
MIFEVPFVVPNGLFLPNDKVLDIAFENKQQVDGYLSGIESKTSRAPWPPNSKGAW